MSADAITYSATLSLSPNQRTYHTQPRFSYLFITSLSLLNQSRAISTSKYILDGCWNLALVPPLILPGFNNSFLNFPGQSLHFTLFGGEKRLSYDLLCNSFTSVYSVDDYLKCQLKVLSDIHKNVKNKLQATTAAMCEQQHRRASPLTLKGGASIMLRVTERGSVIVSEVRGTPLNNTKIWWTQIWSQRSLVKCNWDCA